MEPVFAVVHDPAVQPPPPPQVQQGGNGRRVDWRRVLVLVLYLGANVAFAFAIYRSRHNPRRLALLIAAHVVLSVLVCCGPRLKQLLRDRKRGAAEMGLADAASRPETALRGLSPEDKV